MRPRPPLGPRDLPLLVPFAAAGAWAVLGHPAAAIAAAALGAAVAVARLVLGDAVHRAVARVTRVAETVLVAAVMTLFWVLTVLPAWVLRGRERAAGPWTPGAARSRARRPFADAAPGPGVVRRLVAASGAFALLLAADLALGTAAIRLGGPRPASTISVVNGEAVADSPALAHEPWAATHGQELARLSTGYWPYLLDRPLPVAGSTINVEGWERRSRPGVPDDAEAVTVAVLGGSTAFGVGQRDGHTIASEIARLAAADGRRVRVVNLGQPGWTSWQEALLLEQLTAGPERRAIDVAAFLDGAHDLEAQRDPETRGHPTYVDVQAVAARAVTRAVDGAPSEDGDVVADVRSWWADHSAVTRVARWLGGGPAGAATEQGPGRGDEEVGTATAEVYARARTFATQVARRRGVLPVFFWQPVLAPELAAAHRVATEALTGPTIDLSDVLDDHPETMIDGVDTNEAGARILAARMWADLRPLVDRVAATR